LYHYDEEGRSLDLPKRPEWNYKMSKETVERNEQQAFHRWLDRILRCYSSEQVSYFETNLEVWRQLWRTLEISDVLLLIVDIRNPLVHFPPLLYSHVVGELGKPLILVLNKIDLVGMNTVEAWKEYFHEKFPELHVVCFTRYPLEHVVADDGTPLKSMIASSNRKRRLARALGIRELLKACSRVVIRKQGILVDWDMLIREHAQEEEEEQQQQESQPIISSDSTDDEEISRTYNIPLFDDPSSGPTSSDYITLGTIGQPNVGKSSLINGLLGRKAVSVSKTPGHTKHFQTIYLTRNVRLCDCPGLVFPTFVPKTLQILTGVFPIAQVQEPYSVIRYLAELCPIERYLKLKHPDMEGSESQSFFWSAWTICEGRRPSIGLQRIEISLLRGLFVITLSWRETFLSIIDVYSFFFSMCESCLIIMFLAFAYSKRFYAAKSGRFDVARAANYLLRMVVNGDLVVSFKPKGFFPDSDSGLVSHESIN
jgi:ribosome biogenesis GTPase A